MWKIQFTILKMRDLNAKVKGFVDHCQKAIAESQVERIAALYADVFLFGGPEGVRSVNREDFVRVLRRRKEFFASVGLISSTVDSLEACELDSKYVLVKAVWRMRFEPRGGHPVESENSASYILIAVGDSFQIVVQIDHQDLVKKAQELGLK